MLLKISEIKPNPQNPRTIKDENFKKLVQSIKDFPEMLDARPLVVNKDNVILGGNMRFKASKEAGLKEVPVKIVDWSEEKQREFIIKDNISGGDWDWDQLANEWDVEQLDEWGLDVPDFAGDVEVEEDEAPEVSQEPPKSELGKVYELGRHRVMCGDSTKIEDVEKLMDGKKADMVFTDPPYGIEYSRHISNKKHSQEMIKNDDTANGWLVNIPKGVPTYVCTRWDVYPLIYSELVELGHIKNVIVWDKKSHGMADLGTTYAPSHEFIVYIAEKSEPLQGNRERDVWASSRDSGLHPTMKPVEIISTALNSHHAKTVLDLFLGSGSTLIACEQTDRTCYGMELDPKYTDVIRKRYAKFVYPDRWEEEWESLTPEAV